ncbi:MAG: divalent-cation tolerance protein CutA [bacterium]
MKGNRTNIALILCSAPTLASGRKVANTLLSKKLAACVSIVPGAESHYVWKGKQEKTKEVLLWIKTTKNNFKNVEKAIRAVHPYECPEIAQIPVTQCFEAYGRWVKRQVAGFPFARE